jgi:hypothetical protein
MARHRRLATFVEGALQPANQRVDFILRGLRIARRRHEAAPQFAYSVLEDLRVLSHGLCGELVEHDIASANYGVVATDAVALYDGPLLFGMRRNLVRGLGKDVSVNRNDTDSTRNAEKISSEFCTSHHEFIVDFDTGK